MPKLKIKPELLSLLTSNKFQAFSCADLVDAYLKLDSSPNLNKKQAHQFIQRNIDRLIWAGFAVKESNNINGRPRYSLTNSFNSANYSIGSPHRKKPTPKTTVSAKPNNHYINDLNEQLKKHKLELLTTISEAEEYEALSSQLPNRRDDLQDLYNDARNRYSKTLGRVRAIESLISKCQEA
ncbi:MAG: hypothetical protein KBT72_01935 [Zhongshania sp.]|uniref:hypothetical protein n=1 Tax=Spongiibacter sp. IMCC21906 TaxID=1620392 RepID=UPI00062E040A|nr:hypothetical protein [Spongiibacter sp. IMCC21906]AKH68805.1 hypothetical protein IMCC21906_01126 [Spongiibacter sp. IMCC21906]MBQ0758387.1 hypothetical protein [Zhongshania sp.]